MKKIIILIFSVLILSINMSNAEDNVCYNSYSMGWNITINWIWDSCSWKYYLKQEKRSACFKIKTIKDWKVINEICDKSYFNDEYSKDEKKIYKPWRRMQNSYYKSVYLELYIDESDNWDEGNYIKYNNHILYDVFPWWYDDSQKEIIWKKEDFLWYYIDDKRIKKIWEYIDNKDKTKQINYYQFSDITKFDYWYTIKVNWKNKHIKAYHLSEKQREKIDNFINNKIPFSKYDRVFSNIEKVRKKYTDMSIRRHRLMKEVLDYIYSEMKIKELKNWKIWIIKYRWDIPVRKWYIEPPKSNFLDFEE